MQTTQASHFLRVKNFKKNSPDIHLRVKKLTQKFTQTQKGTLHKVVQSVPVGIRRVKWTAPRASEPVALLD
jgi:hypothetical protein